MMGGEREGGGGLRVGLGEDCTTSSSGAANEITVTRFLGEVVEVDVLDNEGKLDGLDATVVWLNGVRNSWSNRESCWPPLAA